MKKLLFGAGLLIVATSAAAAQGYYGAYGYGVYGRRFPPGLYNLCRRAECGAADRLWLRPLWYRPQLAVLPVQRAGARTVRVSQR